MNMDGWIKMPKFTEELNPMSISRTFAPGTLAAPTIPTIIFDKGELTEKESKQMNVMCWLDFYGLTKVCETMDSDKIGFTEAYFKVKGKRELR